MSDTPLRIAMWSGPRNISTAMLRSWGARRDTFVCDEPLYAHYLLHTGLPHPGADEVIAHHETDWRKAVAWLTGPVPEGKSIFYQKQMSHHLLPHIDRGWLSQVTNCFLIREPREMLTSLLKFIAEPTLADTGLPQQVEIFEQTASRQGRPPPVIDARDVLENPRRMLGLLCDALGLSFDECMLRWGPGPRETDGIWAKHWYAQVLTTTGFGTYQPKDEQVPESLLPLLDQCQRLYEQLHRHRIR
jgi:hypothetical protein